MKRKIVNIDQEKCIGCGLCAAACHEGAIAMIDGKARLIKDDYCDGLGDCLPHCPADAIHIVEREANEYDDLAVKKHMEDVCNRANTADCEGVPAHVIHKSESALQNWPPQIKLCPTNASYFENAHLLIAADCTAFSYANFHHDFMRKRVTLIGCPKLDAIDYSEKLTEIIANNSIKSITVLRMEVPCCGGLEYAVKKAIENSGKDLHYSVRIVGINGEILDTHF